MVESDKPVFVPDGYVDVHVSHYWPAWGSVNCFRFVNGECLSPTASGEPWQDWIERGAACVKAWPFGTRIQLPGGEEFVCVDRGGKIVYGTDGFPWIDLMVQHPPVEYGTIIRVGIIWPK